MEGKIIMKDFEFIVTNDYDCDYLVVEIWYQNNLIAEVKENGEIELFEEDKNKDIITSDSFDVAIETAKKKLRG